MPRSTFSRQPPSSDEPPSPPDSHLAAAREVFEIEIAALEAVASQLDHSFNRTVDLFLEILRAKGKIIVTGIGKSGNIGKKIASTLTSTGAAGVALNTVDALHGDLGILCEGDGVLALSYSGESEELLNLIPALKRFGVRIVSMTAAPDSSLARCSDIVLNVKVPREACPFNLAPTSSTTAMLAMGDALAMALLRARGFKPGDFARHHPAGAIGKALWLRMADIMRTGPRNPVAPQEASVKEALLAMTRAKAGCLSIINSEGKLVGVFTDGDLRRQMAAQGDVLALPLFQVMTPNPVSARETEMAVEALRIFKERNIDDLIVVNEHREPVGLVDMQDLPKLKLV
jgi:arabinose-5-phosphate isomerase